MGHPLHKNTPSLHDEELRFRGDRPEPASLEFETRPPATPPALQGVRALLDQSESASRPLVRRLSPLQLSLLLIIGMGIGGYLYVNQLGQAPVHGPESVAVSVLSEPGATTHDAADVSAVNASAAQRLHLDQRRFLYTRGSLRGSEPGFQQPATAADAAKNARSTPTEADFRPIPSAPSRYTTQDSAHEWQGGWRYDDPEHNLQLGKSYDRYIRNSFGSPKLSVAGERPLDILPRMEGLAAEPAPR